LNPVHAGYSGMYTAKGDDGRRDGIWSGREGHDQAANGCLEVVKRLTVRLLNESRSHSEGEFASLHRYLIRFDVYTVGASFMKHGTTFLGLENRTHLKTTERPTTTCPRSGTSHR